MINFEVWKFIVLLISIVISTASVVVAILTLRHKRIELKVAKKISDNEHFTWLNKTTFITEYTQGEMLDRASLYLEILPDNQLKGTISITFQEPWENQSAKQQKNRLYKKTDKLDVHGFFLKHSEISLTYENKDLIHHSGTILLTPKAKGYVGYFVTYHPEVPVERRTIENQNEKDFSYGYAEFYLSTDKLATKFMQLEPGNRTFKMTRDDAIDT